MENYYIAVGVIVVLALLVGLLYWFASQFPELPGWCKKHGMQKRFGGRDDQFEVCPACEYEYIVGSSLHSAYTSMVAESTAFYVVGSNDQDKLSFGWVKVQPGRDGKSKYEKIVEVNQHQVVFTVWIDDTGTLPKAIAFALNIFDVETGRVAAFGNVANVISKEDFDLKYQQFIEDARGAIKLKQQEALTGK